MRCIGTSIRVTIRESSTISAHFGTFRLLKAAEQDNKANEVSYENNRGPHISGELGERGTNRFEFGYHQSIPPINENSQNYYEAI